jgi:hypothetical protein
MEQLQAYGILAVPVLEEMIEQGKLSDDLAIRAQKQIDNFALTDTAKVLLVGSIR